jgi:hypothetical protein
MSTKGKTGHIFLERISPRVTPPDHPASRQEDRSSIARASCSFDSVLYSLCASIIDVGTGRCNAAGARADERPRLPRCIEFWVSMRGRKIALILVGIGATVALLAVHLLMPRRPVELTVIKAEPSAIIYFGEKRGIQVTLGVRHSDSVSMYDIQSFQVRVGGRWLEFQGAAGFPSAGFPGMVGGGIITGTGGTETLVVPEGAEAYRVQVRYHAPTWRWQFNQWLGPRTRNWITKTRWLKQWLSPDPGESKFYQPPRTNLIAIKIPRSDGK